MNKISVMHMGASDQRNLRELNLSMAIKFSISSMLQLTVCIAVLFASYGFLPSLRGFKPGFVIERQIFNCCLAGAFFPSLVISLCRLHVTSRYCWQSIFISTIISSWMGFFLVHRWWAHMWQSHSSQPQWPGMAGVLLDPFAVISSLIISVLVATLVNRGILRLFGRGTILKNHRRKIALLKKANRRMPDLLFRLQNNTDDEATRLELFHIVEAFPFDFAAQVYLAALDAVKTPGGIPTAKQLALDIGRISYSHARADKKPTIYDEAAIQHDIKCTL